MREGGREGVSESMDEGEDLAVSMTAELMRVSEGGRKGGSE